MGVVYGSDFAATRLRAMELITILNRCHRFRSVPYCHLAEEGHPGAHRIHEEFE